MFGGAAKIVLIFDLFQSVKKYKVRTKKKHQKSWQFISKLENCIFAESEQNKLKTGDFICSFQWIIWKYRCRHQIHTVSKCQPADFELCWGAFRATKVSLIHHDSFFLTISSNFISGCIRNSQPSLFFTLLWTSTALLILEYRQFLQFLIFVDTTW